MSGLATIKKRNKSASTAAHLRIGDVAKATGKSQRAIRLYEEMGLLPTPKRSDGGFREYGRDVVSRVRFINELQDLGVSLPDLRALLEKVAQQASPRNAMEHLRTVFERKLIDIDVQIESLRRTRGELHSALAYLDGCGTCAAHDAGPSTCVSCGEQSVDVVPKLVKEATRSAKSIREASTL